MTIPRVKVWAAQIDAAEAAHPGRKTAAVVRVVAAVESLLPDTHTPMLLPARGVASRALLTTRQLGRYKTAIDAAYKTDRIRGQGVWYVRRPHLADGRCGYVPEALLSHRYAQAMHASGWRTPETVTAAVRYALVADYDGRRRRNRRTGHRSTSGWHRARQLLVDCGLVVPDAGWTPALADTLDSYRHEAADTEQQQYRTPMEANAAAATVIATQRTDSTMSKGQIEPLQRTDRTNIQSPINPLNNPGIDDGRMCPLPESAESVKPEDLPPALRRFAHHLKGD